MTCCIEASILFSSTTFGGQLPGWWARGISVGIHRGTVTAGLALGQVIHPIHFGAQLRIESVQLGRDLGWIQTPAVAFHQPKVPLPMRDNLRHTRIEAGPWCGEKPGFRLIIAKTSRDLPITIF